MPCPICNDSQRVRLPINRIYTRVLIPEEIETLTPSYKEYPCPECSKYTILLEISPENENDPHYIDYLKRYACESILNNYIEKNSFDFEIISRSSSPNRTLKCTFPKFNNDVNKEAIIEAIKEYKNKNSNKSILKSEVVNLIKRFF